VIAPSPGGGCPGELRMQDPADVESITAQLDAVTLLLRVWQPEAAGESVLVVWDAARRTRKRQAALASYQRIPCSALATKGVPSMRAPPTNEC
jgi:hypothetical protein